MEQTISQLILKIYQTVDQCASNQLKEALFECLQECVSFDSGKWIVGRLNNNSFEIYSRCSFLLPEESLLSTTPIQFQNSVIRPLFDQPGTTLNVNAEFLQQYANQMVPSEALSTRMDVRAALSTLIQRPGFTDASIFSIYRKPDQPDFSDEERQCLEQVTPHIIQAFHLGAQIKQSQQWDGNQHWAIVDNSNYIRYCSDQFREFIGGQIGEPVEQQLPVQLIDALKQREPHLGTLSVERRSLAGNAEFISLVERGVLSQLTPSEKRVVEHYARGLSYKKVAQQLDISHHTVIKHVNNVYRKLNINNKNQLIELVAPVLS
ncbi:MAG: helix-turn-helix transcriptional regulator [Marinobacterium sp.]|nr:helix-turn-helix transcriptional regulator [Marinobacterium sp.]